MIEPQLNTNIFLIPRHFHPSPSSGEVKRR